MDRATILKLWNEAWSEGLWAAPWHKSVAGLTTAQAAWSPGPGRHSIWQIIEHMMFWREDTLRRLAGGARPTPAELASGNFPQIGDRSEAAWRATVERFEGTQRRIAEALADPGNPLDRLGYLLPHDSYHVGQINYLRALQELPPIE
jgi:hypothetical protein